MGLISESANLDPCLLGCLSDGLGASIDRLESVTDHYKKARNNTIPLPPPLPPLFCPGTVITSDGKVVVSPPQEPRRIVRKEVVPSSSSHTIELPQGWGDDEVYTWQIGRPTQDYVEMKRYRGATVTDPDTPRYESRTVIHPKKNLHLRFPSLRSGTFRQNTPSPDDFVQPYVRIRVEGCQCLTGAGCNAYTALRYPGVPQCTYLGFVETTPDGFFRVFCEGQPPVDGDPPLAACGYSADGQDVVFTVIRMLQSACECAREYSNAI